MKRGLFYPELTLGAEALSYARHKEIRDFFCELIHQRGFPLHVANLWNALYFSWDLEEQGYVAATVNLNRIPQRQMNERDFALPIGGFTRVLTPTKVGELWAEVVYKEWAHPEVGAEWMLDRLSGAPAAPEEFAGEPVAVARERLVLDLNAFGAGFNEITSKQYQRLLDRGRWLDEHGHLVMEAIYSQEEADLEDLDHYAQYLLANHREGLLAFCFREEPSEEELRIALLRSLDAVREIASDCGDLACWRGKYFFDRSDFEQQCRDEGVDTILGADDLNCIFKSLVRPSRWRNVVYNAIGPRILEFLRRRGDFTEEEQAIVRGPAYTTAVCHANAYVRNRILAEAPDGLLPDNLHTANLHLRLDDDRQAGGIWRCERVDGHTSLTLVPPTFPLGLGYSEVCPETEFTEPELDPVPTSMQGFRVTLTKRDINLGRLRLPERIVGTLGAHSEIQLRLRYGEECDNQNVRFEPEARMLTDIAWPFDFFPGLILHCNVESGGAVVKARAKELTQPVTIEDFEIRYEFKERVYRRETSEQQLPKEEFKSAPTLNDLIHRAFRNRGRPTEDGARALMSTEIISAILGPDWRPDESRPITIALQRLGLEYRGGEYIWRPRITRRTSVFDRAMLAAYGEEQPRHRLLSIVRRHWVPMHLRRLATWQERPGLLKVETYAEARRNNGLHGVLPPMLPPGYTWVEPHERGSPEEL